MKGASSTSTSSIQHTTPILQASDFYQIYILLTLTCIKQQPSATKGNKVQQSATKFQPNVTKCNQVQPIATKCNQVHPSTTNCNQLEPSAEKGN